jgi:hypothetical protein
VHTRLVALVAVVLLVAGMSGVVALAAAVELPADDVVAGGIVILRPRVAAGGFTAVERSGIFYERLNNIITDTSVKPSDVRAVQVRGDWTVMAERYLFVTASAQDAAANRTTPKDLAQTWAANLAKAISLARPVPPPPGGPYNE